MRAPAALQRSLCILSVFFVGFGQTAYSSLPVFSLVQAFSHCSKVICSNASLIVARDLPSFYSSREIEFHMRKKDPGASYIESPLFSICLKARSAINSAPSLWLHIILLFVGLIPFSRTYVSGNRVASLSETSQAFLKLRHHCIAAFTRMLCRFYRCIFFQLSRHEYTHLKKSSGGNGACSWLKSFSLISSLPWSQNNLHNTVSWLFLCLMICVYLQTKPVSAQPAKLSRTRYSYNHY